MQQANNVLLVILDSVRAANCSLYGHPEPTTPFLERFATSEATLFEHAKAAGAKSLTSHASIFSGLVVEEHGIRTAGTKLSPEQHAFATLGRRGYDTAVFSENDWLTAVDVGLKDGFERVVGAQNIPYPESVNPDEFVSVNGPGEYGAYLREAVAAPSPLKALANGVSKKVKSDYSQLLPRGSAATTPGRFYVDRFLEWSRNRGSPWAACINLMDAHLPYEPLTEFDQWDDGSARSLQSEFQDQTWDFHGGRRPWWQKRAVESVYDGTILQCDTYLRRLIESLRARGELDDTLVIITADHGEGFGEPSRLDSSMRIAAHGVSGHEAILHVPLVIRVPGQAESTVISKPFSLSWLREILEAEKPGEIVNSIVADSKQVLSAALGLDAPGKRRAESYVEDTRPWHDDTRVVYEWDESGGQVVKHVSRGEHALTVLCRDAQTQWVQGDGTGSRGRIAAAYRTVEPASSPASGDGINDLDDETRDRLERLGYL